MIKKCIECDTILIKRAHESKKRFGNKRFCSSACSRSYLKEHKMGWWSENKMLDYPIPSIDDDLI